LAALAKVPTYVLDNARRQANTRRLLALARRLTIDGLSSSWPEAKTLTVETLRAEAERLRKNPDFAAKITGKARINIKEFKVEFGELHALREGRTIAVEITPENIDDLFSKCENILGEGIKDDYWRRVHDHDEPDLAKLELFCVLQDPAAVRVVQDECGKRLDRLFEEFRDQIEQLPSSRREHRRPPAKATARRGPPWSSAGTPAQRRISPLVQFNSKTPRLRALRPRFHGTWSYLQAPLRPVRTSQANVRRDRTTGAARNGTSA
jgi:hypothetical protein